MTYYQILQIAPDASPEVIEGSWKALLRKFHPDVNKSTAAKNKAVQLNEAHDVLSDPRKRREYDRALAAQECVADASPGNGNGRRSQRRGSPGGAYGPAYFREDGPPPAPRDPTFLMKEFIQDIATTGVISVDSFLDAAQELMLAKLAETSPVLAALMREQLMERRKR